MLLRLEEFPEHYLNNTDEETEAKKHLDFYV